MSDALRRRTMTSREVADALRVSLDTFYRQRELWHTRDGMPRPITQGGCLRFDRASMDAWLGRYHPLAPAGAANDAAPPIVPASDEQHRARLARAYGRSRQ